MEQTKHFLTCHKDKQTVKTIVIVCKGCKLAFHPKCIPSHKVQNEKGESVPCTAGYYQLDQRTDVVSPYEVPEVPDGGKMSKAMETDDNAEQTTTSNGNKKRKFSDDGSDASNDESDEEILRRLIQKTIRDEVSPLKAKIDELQSEIVASKNEVVSLKEIINELRKENVTLRNNNSNNQTEKINDPCASASFASAVQKKKKDTTIVVKPTNVVDTDTQSKVNKNENLDKVKNNINVKELGVGVKSIRQNKNGTVVMKFKNVNDKEKLQKKVTEKVGDQYKVQIPKEQKKFVKILYIHKEEANLSNEEIIDDIIKQNDLTVYFSKIEMKIVKRIVNDKKNEFSVIVEVNAELQKLLLFLEKISLGWKQCKVIEHINVMRCFKCCGYNHQAKECKSELRCGKCGGKHESKTCEVTELKCTNCSHYKNTKTGKELNIDDKHNAFDKRCPIYTKVAESYKRRAEESS